MTRPQVQRLVDLHRGRPGALAPAVGSAPEGAPQDKLLLSKEEAARRLGIGHATLRALIADGTIYAITVGAKGRHMRIPVAEIEKFRTGRYGPGTDHGRP